LKYHAHKFDLLWPCVTLILIFDLLTHKVIILCPCPAAHNYNYD